jgi:DNA polymerase
MIESTRQVTEIIKWLAARGCVVEDLQKENLPDVLKRTDLTPEVRRVIELRLEAAHIASDKFKALKAWRGIDGRVRGALNFHGAATGRWSGAGPQPQNFRKEDET